MLSEQLLSTFSKLCYGVKIVYNYGLWKREVQEGLLVFGVYPFLPFSQEISAELLTRTISLTPPPPPMSAWFL
jgi:hypothetical protein